MAPGATFWLSNWPIKGLFGQLSKQRNLVLRLVSLSSLDLWRENEKYDSVLGDYFVEIENGAGHGGPGGVTCRVERLVARGFAELKQLPGTLDIGVECL